MKAGSFFGLLLCVFLAQAQHISQPSDTLYTARAAMLVYGTDPARALRIIDSALIVGNVNAFEADYCRAKIYAHSPTDPRHAEAIALCQDLLQRDSTRITSASTAENRMAVFQLLMDCYRVDRDYENWLKYAIELADLNRERGQETEALRMEAEIGVVLTQLGRHDEGLAKLNEVIAVLDAGAPSVDRMDAGIVARKRKIAVLNEDGNFHAVIPEADAIIRKLEDYERRPEVYAEDSFRLPPIGEDRVRYCQFYKAQAWGFLARAYACKTPADLAEARRYLQLFERSDYGHSFSGRRMVAPAWKALGEWDKLLAIDTEVEARMGADTLSADYATLLKDRADAAMALGDPDRALAYMNRYSALQQELNRLLQESDAQEYAARYHANEQERKIQDAESRLARKNFILFAVVILMLISAAATYYYGRQRHKINEKNRTPDPELFRTIDRIIREQRLYANASLQRQDILNRFSISRRTLSDLLAAHAGGQSLTAYINAMRLQDAVHLLRDEPGMSLSDIAENVGFTPATFRDQFKRQFGMTPTEYRQNL